MRARVTLLLMILAILMLNIPAALAQEETPSVIEQFAQTATALIEARTGTPTPSAMDETLEPTDAMSSPDATAEPTEEATLDVTEEATIEAVIEPTEEAVVEPVEEATATPAPVETTETEEAGSEVRGLPLGVLLIGAVAVLLIGTVVLVRENPRPLDDEE